MTDTHIKINAVTPRVQYTGNGVTTVFPYEFAIFDETDMVVYLGDEVQESGYSVSGAGQTEGGNVTFDVAPEDGVKITLLRSIPIERITDFQEGGTFRPKNLNDEFDRQTAFLQQVQETLDRSVKVGPTSDITPEFVLSQVERVYDSIDNVDVVADNINNVNNVSSNMSDVSSCADNMSVIQDAPTQAANAANSAGESAASAELSAQYANDKINQTHISNCITDIPQDIKLELDNGTLTLKAGSKVRVPNGVGVFDEVIISSDESITSYSTIENGKILFFYVPSADGLDYELNCVSGPSHTPSSYSAWYDTTNNVINRYTDNSSTVAYTLSFPIAVVSIKNYVFDSIDQIFNGFGYIGSTIFALPGVKGLIPNGRNEDGTLKNTDFTLNNVIVKTQGNYTFDSILLVNDNDIVMCGEHDFLYDESSNYNIYTPANENMPVCVFGRCRFTSSVISNWSNKTVFRTLDWNDKGTIAGWSMPGNRYIDLTLGASPALYVAPADGYVNIVGNATASNVYNCVRLYSSKVGSICWSSAEDNTVNTYIPVSKGDSFYVFYNQFSVLHFRFVYLKGEENV